MINFNREAGQWKTIKFDNGMVYSLAFAPQLLNGAYYASFATNIDGDALSIGRFGLDGTVDTTFGVEGFVQVKSGNGAFSRHVLVMHGSSPESSRLLSISYCSISAQAFVLMKQMTPDGKPDNSFGEKGERWLPWPEAASAAPEKQTDAAASPAPILKADDGKAALFAAPKLAQLLLSGAFDTEFNKTGVLNNIEWGGQTLTPIACTSFTTPNEPTGYYLGGLWIKGTTWQPFLAAYDGQGKQVSFGDFGIWTRATLPGTDPELDGASAAVSHALQAVSGAVYISGHLSKGGGYVLRLTSNGQIDATFNKGEVARLDAPKWEVFEAGPLVEYEGGVVVAVTHKSTSGNERQLRWVQFDDKGQKVGEGVYTAINDPFLLAQTIKVIDQGVEIGGVFYPSNKASSFVARYTTS